MLKASEEEWLAAAKAVPEADLPPAVRSWLDAELGSGRLGQADAVLPAHDGQAEAGTPVTDGDPDGGALAATELGDLVVAEDDRGRGTEGLEGGVEGHVRHGVQPAIERS